MIALICAFSDFHFAQQSVHFFDGQPAVGADCAMASHSGQYFVALGG